MGFCKWAEKGPKVGFWVQRWVESGSKPTLNPFRDFAKTHGLASSREIVF